MVELYPKGTVSPPSSVNGKTGIALVEEAYTEQSPVYVANINAPRQIVIAVPMKVWTKY